MDNQECTAAILAYLRGEHAAAAEDIAQALVTVAAWEASESPVERSLAGLVFSGQVNLAVGDGRVLVVDRGREKARAD